MIAIMQLKEAGALTLEATLSHFKIDYIVPNQDTISIANLLMHRSGLHDRGFMAYQKDEPLGNLISAEMLFVPNDEFSYAHINYVLLGKIIEQVTSLEIHTYIENLIIAPLALRNTGMIKDTPTPSNLTQGFNYNPATHRLEDKSNFSIWSAANMYSNSADLCTLIEDFFLHHTILTEQSMIEVIDSIHELAFTVRRRHGVRTRQANMGYAIEAYEFDNQWFFGTFGWQHSHASCVLYQPQKQYSIALTCAKTQGLSQG